MVDIFILRFSIRNFAALGINASRIGLAPQESSSHSKVVKLGKVGFLARILDLYKSNPFGEDISASSDDIPIPESWYDSSPDFPFTSSVYIMVAQAIKG